MKQITATWCMDNGWALAFMPPDNQFAYLNGWEMYRYLNQEVGEGNWHQQGYNFFFKDPKHASYFILKWRKEC